MEMSFLLISAFSRMDFMAIVHIHMRSETFLQRSNNYFGLQRIRFTKASKKLRMAVGSVISPTPFKLIQKENAAMVWCVILLATASVAIFTKNHRFRILVNGEE